MAYGKKPHFAPYKRSQYLKDNLEETTKMVEEQFEKTKNDKHAKELPLGQLNKTGYFSQNNVKEYQKEMTTHLFGKNKAVKTGRGNFFETNEELEEWIAGYIELCMKCDVVPTISGLCTWLRCHRDTIYSHASNPNSPFYDTLRSVIDFCHTCLESGASESKLNSVAYIFQAKNYFSMKDTTDVQISANTNNNEVASTETLNALKEQVEEEKSNKKIDMRDAIYEEVKRNLT